MGDNRDAKRLWRMAVEDPRSVGRREEREWLRELLVSPDTKVRRRAADVVAKLAYAAPELAAPLREEITEASHDDDHIVRDRARRALRHMRDADPEKPPENSHDGSTTDDADVDPTVIYEATDGPVRHDDPTTVESNASPTSVYEDTEGSDTNFCPNCGTDLRGQSVLNFCGGCGHEL